MRFGVLFILLVVFGDGFTQSNAIGWSEGVAYRRQITDKLYLGYTILPRMTIKGDYSYFEVKNGIQAGYTLASWERLNLNLAEELYVRNYSTETEEKTATHGYGISDLIGIVPQFQVYKSLYIEKIFGISFSWEKNKEAQDGKWTDPIDTYRIDAVGDEVNLFSSFRILVKF